MLDAQRESFSKADSSAAVAACTSAFIDSWKSGNPLTIECSLENFRGSDLAQMATILVGLEINFRRDRGETPAAADYVCRFPQYRDEIVAVFAHSTPEPAHLDSTLQFQVGVSDTDDGDFQVASSAVGVASSHTSSSAAGLSRYQRVARLGIGGFAEVWRARDVRLDRDVAIKLPRPDKVFPESIRVQFLAEARRVASLESIPGIVRVIDVADDPADFHIVMQLVEGETLAARLADPSRPRLSCREIAEMVADLATALDEVHGHQDNITHRDLKPQNILLDKRGRPHISDFGLAISEREQLLEPPAQQGTRPYLSPEQARFESHLVDGRSDIFSLGIIFYEMLCGVRPFAGRTAAEITDSILRSEPRPLRARDPSIPKELERICLKCLEKKMSDRYLTAGDLATDLRNWCTQANSPTPVTQTNPFDNKSNQNSNFWSFGGLALVTAGILVVGVLGTIASITRPENTPKTQPTTGNSPLAPGAAKSPIPTSRAEQDFITAFGKSPSRSTWEGKRGRGRHDFVDEPGLRALEVSSETVWLVELGDLPESDFDFAIELRQPDWDGRIGVFIGKHVEEFGEKNKLQEFFQVICLQNYRAIQNIRPHEFRIERSKVYIDYPNHLGQTFVA
ncbi:MAG: serine/threonine protein kinase, partial [Planctomycetes bacterium]|nr:serine/threonine protein kinase [Planctomycetota bacterium]